MTLDNLPPEIMFMILVPAYFTTPVTHRLSQTDMRKIIKDYINLRLVSQTFSAIITPQIFQHLRIKSSECSLKRLEAISKSENLKGLVKTYTYSFAAAVPSGRGTVHDEYLRLMADPSGIHNPDSIRSSTDPGMVEVAHWLDQRDFELSNDMHEIHANHLNLLPNLKSISLEAPSWCGLSDVPYDLGIGPGGGRPWGPVAFRAILTAMYNRTQTPGVTPLETLVVEGVSEECMLLPPSFISKAITAMHSIKNLRLCIRALRETSELSTPGWILLIGRLIQSAPSLESLELEVQDNTAEIFFRPLVTPSKSRLAPRPEPAPAPPPHWPNLTKLLLHDVIFTESHIIKFLTSHKRTLRSIQFTLCHLRIDSEPSITDIDPGVCPFNPWPAVLRTIYKHHTPGSSSALKFFNIRDLYYNPVRPRRLHFCEMALWSKYILGTFDDYPIEPTPPVPGSDSASWCIECQEEETFNDGFSTDESETEYFFGGFGGLWGDEDEEDDELISEDEDVDEDDEYFLAGTGTGMDGMYGAGGMYSLPGAHVGWDGW